jgi:hypothetical protein
MTDHDPPKPGVEPAIDVAAIHAKRRERAVEEDRLRPAALERRRAALATIQKRLEAEANQPALTPEKVQEMIEQAVAKALAGKAGE